MTPSHEPQASYDGTATVLVDDTEQAVTVALRGAFQPLDGHFHWYGRIAQMPALATLRSGTAVRLRTEHGEADARVSDRDPWGRLRITGTGPPPF